MRKKVDSRVRTLIENGVKTRERSLFLIIGDSGKDQVVNLHYMLAKAQVKARPSVLWCYKKDLGFTSHQKKRMKQIKKDIQRGIRDPNEDNPFELFLSSTNIRYVYYKDSHKVLGNTFGCLVLQDFEALTPNILARTIETVEGGGIVIMLLKKMDSLKQFFTMTMDVHSRFRTESHQDVVGRFNERFILSLSSCSNALVLDDELNILPISSHMRNIKPVSLPSQSDDSNDDVYLSKEQKDLRDLKARVRDTPDVGNLVACARTLDQANAILKFVDAITEKTLRSTISLTAARGRGKSAALGLSIAAAVSCGYSNIFVTAPTPENLKTLFEMVFKGFDALEFKEHRDYEIIQSTNPEFGQDCVIRVNIFKEHRQTIQYIHPKDYQRLAQAELLVIDEAAAIPLPVVKNLFGPYLVFLSSTINGYEGTGRSLSLKLLKQLREQTVGGTNLQVSATGRMLNEITLEEPIRYAPGDKIESWLNELLCLDCSNQSYRLNNGVPHPSQCDLYYVNRDTLFSYHRASESFLQRMMSLYVSSHYKNSPNDLQLLSDAPAHHLFVLLGPVDSNSEGLPDVLAVVQVCLEGAINRESVKASLSRGIKQSGDLIPWTVSQQYQDHDFPGLSGARIVRIAVHPDAQRMGYGSRALELIKMYYEGHFANLSEASDHVESNSALASQSGKSSTIHDEVLEPRKNLPPLMEALTDRPPESLHWLGTSYGVTQSLYNFWKKSGFKSVYLRQTENELTGEHSCIMIRNLEGNALNDISNASWLENFTKDFQRRFMTLLSYNFRNFEAALGLSILDPSPKVVNASALHQLDDSQDADDKEGYSWELLKEYVTDFDLQRLDAYSRNLVDYHMILDLIPDMAKLVFLSKAPVSISHAQAAILLAVGLQRKSIDDVEKEFHLMSNQILATFNKVVKKVSSYLKKQRENGIKETLPETKHTVLKPLATSLQSELSEAAQEISEHLKQKQNELIKSIDVDKYAVGGTDQDWNNVLKSSKEAPSTISVKSNGQKKRFIPNFNSEKGKDKNKSSKKMKIKSGHGVK